MPEDHSDSTVTRLYLDTGKDKSSKMKLYEAQSILAGINDIKQNNSGTISNIVSGKLSKDCKYEAIIEKDALSFLYPDSLRKRKSLFFIGANKSDVIRLLDKSRGKDVVCDYLSRTAEDPFEEIMRASGFKHNSTYVRHTTFHKENPFLIPPEGRRRILFDLYDPCKCKYASEDDIQQLMEINKRAFVEYVDDFFSYEDWMEIIDRKECYVCKEGNRVIAFYVWKIEGKKFYANMIYNEGTADLSYTMERKAFEEAWEKGIRILYYWIRSDNTKALQHNGIDGKSTGELYDHIWTCNGESV